MSFIVYRVVPLFSLVAVVTKVIVIILASKSIELHFRDILKGYILRIFRMYDIFNGKQRHYYYI